MKAIWLKLFKAKWLNSLHFNIGFMTQTFNGFIEKINNGWKTEK